MPPASWPVKSRFRERSCCRRYAPGVRFVIFGAGAIGGVVGARLAQAGRDVVLIARGAHYDAIREHGLRIEDPVQRAVLVDRRVSDPRRGARGPTRMWSC